MRDEGVNNAQVGHRQWLLRAESKKMGVGVVIGDDSQYDDSTAIWVVGETRPITDASVLMRDRFVAWPPPGFVPSPLVYRRWSISIPDADIAEATVAVWVETNQVSTTIESRSYRFGNGTLVWLLPEAYVPEPAETLKFTVVVSDVIVDDVPTRFEYQVFSTDHHSPPTEIYATEPLTIPENLPIDEVFATLRAQDADAGETHFFMLVEGAGSEDNALFNIIGDSLATKIRLDYESRPIYNIRVEATDPWGLSVSQPLTITVEDVEEALLYIPAIKDSQENLGE
jgi:hypothetical protein